MHRCNAAVFFTLHHSLPSPAPTAPQTDPQMQPRSKYWGECGDREPLYTVGGMKINPATVEINMEIPENLKIELPYDPAIPLLGTHRRACSMIQQSHSLTATCCSTSCDGQALEPASRPTMFPSQSASWWDFQHNPRCAEGSMIFQVTGLMWLFVSILK
jgi:hypothetical protein